MDSKSMISILFVCMGNICRSPTAEGVFRKFVEDADLADEIRVDSAGTHAYHVGQSPDRRAQAAAERRGYSLAKIRARRVAELDYSEFEYIVAMDEHNLAILKDMQPPESNTSIKLFLDFLDGWETEVPDPYYGGAAGFERVLDLVEDASRALLQHIEKGK